MAKYLATSLAMEDVVSAPRVARSCLPISTISISPVGFESRSCVARFLGRLRAAVHHDSHVGLRQCGRVIVPSPVMDQRAFRLDVADQRASPPASPRRSHRRRPRLLSTPSELVVAGDHDGADPHPAQLGEALLDLRLDDVRAPTPSIATLGDDQRRRAAAGHFLGTWWARRRSRRPARRPTRGPRQARALRSRPS